MNRLAQARVVPRASEHKISPILQGQAVTYVGSFGTFGTAKTSNEGAGWVFLKGEPQHRVLQGKRGSTPKTSAPCHVEEESDLPGLPQVPSVSGKGNPKKAPEMQERNQANSEKQLDPGELNWPSLAGFRWCLGRHAQTGLAPFWVYVFLRVPLFLWG